MDTTQKSEKMCDKAKKPKKASSLDAIEVVECGINVDEPDVEEITVEDTSSEESDDSIRSFVIVFKNPIRPSLCETCRAKYIPNCPPPVCYMLTEQLVVFVALAIVLTCIFLIYWFVQD